MGTKDQYEQLTLFGGESGLLTAKQVARQLAISEKTVYAYVSKGLIPFIKIESNIRFRPQSIREWVNRKEYMPVELKRKTG